MSNFLLLMVQLVSVFLKTVRKHDDCPDGICDAPLADAAVLTAKLSSPKVSMGFLDMMSFLRCFPMARVFAVGKRIMALFQECKRCPDGDCSIFDILSCINLEEAVSIAKEVLDIIRDSQTCVDDDGTEITLGQVS